MTHSSNFDRRPIAESDLHGYLDGELAQPVVRAVFEDDRTGTTTGGRVIRGTRLQVDELGPVTDTADVSGPTGLVGNTLRATAHTESTVAERKLSVENGLPGT